MRKTPNVVVVLAAMRDLEAPYGMQIARHTGLKDETVYRVLERLQLEGWLTSQLSGRLRRYQLTQLGKSWAAAWTQPVGDEPVRVRRRSDEVWVIRWLGTNWPAVEAFCSSAVRRDGDVLWIRTVDDNEESARLGWWIVAGVHNRYPIPPDVFDATYELP